MAMRSGRLLLCAFLGIPRRSNAQRIDLEVEGLVEKAR